MTNLEYENKTSGAPLLLRMNSFITDKGIQNHLFLCSLFAGSIASISFALGFVILGTVMAVFAILMNQTDPSSQIFARSASRLRDRLPCILILCGLIIWYRAEVLILCSLFSVFLGSFMLSYASVLAQARKIKITLLPRGLQFIETIFYISVGGILSALTPFFRDNSSNTSVLLIFLALCIGMLGITLNIFVIRQLSQLMTVLRSQITNRLDGEAQRNGWSLDNTGVVESIP